MLKKSVIIAGRHYTSISLEKEFFDELINICSRRNISLNQLITEIDTGRSEKNNLSSAVRIYVLNHLKKQISA